MLTQPSSEETSAVPMQWPQKGGSEVLLIHTCQTSKLMLLSLPQCFPIKSVLRIFMGTTFMLNVGWLCDIYFFTIKKPLSLKSIP